MLMNGFITPKALALSPETLQMMWQTPILGMAMIFAVLSLLWLVLIGFKMIFAKPEKKEDVASVVAPAPVEETVVEEETSDDELVAVITAAVAAYMAQEEPDAAPNGFRVVSFRRTNGGKAWNSK